MPAVTGAVARALTWQSNRRWRFPPPSEIKDVGCEEHRRRLSTYDCCNLSGGAARGTPDHSHIRDVDNAFRQLLATLETLSPDADLVRRMGT